MIAAIALTLRKRTDVKRNRPSEQVKARAADRVRLVSLQSQTEAPAEAAQSEPAQGDKK
jgi:NADH-quinone oxidoreductase subunit J